MTTEKLSPRMLAIVVLWLRGAMPVRVRRSRTRVAVIRSALAESGWVISVRSSVDLGGRITKVTHCANLFRLNWLDMPIFCIIMTLCVTIVRRVMTVNTAMHGDAGCRCAKKNGRVGPNDSTRGT
ncbi:hypothetical protein [Burkholderia pseudomallei]|uniref:hypothetical protein n=1 Tax=Burkholderia pseudomallei TaxID=28450 RepID=UPI0022EAA574|nr:hypothetical protein [Burkholderia pseudomallei]